MSFVIGISAFYHDSAAALVHDGEIAAAAQEERFTRVKHDPAFPSHAITYCLEEAFIDPSELSQVVFYDDPVLTLDRVLSTLMVEAPESAPRWPAVARAARAASVSLRERHPPQLRRAQGVCRRDPRRGRSGARHCCSTFDRLRP